MNNWFGHKPIQHYAPYGVPFDEPSTFGTPFMFTGEMMDDNGLEYLRARYYNPSLGVFPSLDPVEGPIQRTTSLNRYGYVEGNPITLIDPTGMMNQDEVPYSCWENCKSDPCQYGDTGNCNPCSGGWLDEQFFRCLDQCRTYEEEHGRDPSASGTWIGIIGNVAVGAIQRRGLQAAAAAGADWVLPIGDLIGAGLICVGAIEAIDDLIQARRHAARSSDTDWRDNIPFVGAIDRDWIDAVPQGREDPPHSCSDSRLSGFPKCGKGYFGFDDAFRTLQQAVEDTPRVSIVGFEENEWYPAELCPGGLHWNIPGISNRPDENLVATIWCCPCCEDLGNAVSLAFNCFIKPHSNLVGF